MDENQQDPNTSFHEAGGEVGAKESTEPTEPSAFHNVEVEGGEKELTEPKHPLTLVGTILFSLLSFVLFVGGGISEIIGDFRLEKALENSTYYDQGLKEDAKWLHGYTVYYCVAFSFIFLVVALLLLSDCCMDGYRYFSGEAIEGEKSRKRQINDTIRYLSLVFSFTSAYKLLIYGSVLNKLRYIGAWSGSDDWTNWKVLIPFWGNYYEDTWTIQTQLKAEIILSVFNIFQAMVLYIPMSVVNHKNAIIKFILQMLLIPPSALLVFIFGFKSVTSSMVYHYTQRHYTEEGIFGRNANTTGAIFGAFFAYSITTILFIMVAEIINQLINKDQRAADTTENISASTNPAAMVRFGSDKLWLNVAGLTGSLTMFSIIDFSITIGIYNSAKVWNWYFTVDTVYNSFLWFFVCFTCCFSCYKGIHRELKKDSVA